MKLHYFCCLEGQDTLATALHQVDQILEHRYMDIVLPFCFKGTRYLQHLRALLGHSIPPARAVGNRRAPSGRLNNSVVAGDDRPNKRLCSSLSDGATFGNKQDGLW